MSVPCAITNMFINVLKKINEEKLFSTSHYFYRAALSVKASGTSCTKVYVGLQSTNFILVFTVCVRTTGRNCRGNQCRIFVPIISQKLSNNTYAVL